MNGKLQRNSHHHLRFRKTFTYRIWAAVITMGLSYLWFGTVMKSIGMTLTLMAGKTILYWLHDKYYHGKYYDKE